MKAKEPVPWEIAGPGCLSFRFLLFLPQQAAHPADFPPLCQLQKSNMKSFVLKEVAELIAGAPGLLQ